MSRRELTWNSMRAGIGLLMVSMAFGLVSARAQEIAAPAVDATAAVAGPMIEFETTDYDFGKIMAEEDIRYEYVFTNTGGQPLEILNVHPTCGCTTAGEIEKVIAPGAQGKIPIEFHTKGYKGKVEKIIRVSTNVPGKQVVTLKIGGEIWEPIEINPRYASFGQIVDKSKASTREVEIVSHLDEPLEIRNVVCSSALFSATVETLEAGKKFKLIVSTVPPLQEGSNRGVIKITTSNEKKPELEILANSYVVPPVQVRPAKILVPEGPLPGPTDRVVFINHNTGDPLQISDVAINGEKVQATLQELSPGKNFKIVVTFNAGFEYPKTEPLVLSFKTSDPSTPRFEVPVQEIPKAGGR